MANATSESNKWNIALEIEEAGTKTITLNQANKFVDQVTDIVVTTPAGALGAGTGSAEAVSDVGILGTAQSTQPSTGHYVKVEGEANVAVATAGFIDEGADVDVSIADVYYPIEEATFSTSGASVVSTSEGYVGANETVGTISNGSQTITGGGLTAGAGSADLSSDGYYDGTSYDTTDKVTLSQTEAAGYYKVTASGSGTVSSAAVTKQVTSAGYFAADASPVTEIAADSETSNTAEEEYFIKKSTLSASTVTPSTSAQTVTIGEGYAPADRTVTVQAMAAGAASSSLAKTGTATYFDAGTSADHDVALTPQHNIDTAGYLAQTANPVDGTTEYLKIKEQTVTETATTVSGASATRGTRTESVGWNDTAETLDVATFANTATSGTSYVDISATTAAPSLASGDYLYINAGWTDALKISLAKLVPDGSNIHGHADAILQGYTAYDNDGALITGTIQTWDGSYTIS